MCAHVLMTSFVWFVFLCTSQGETPSLQVASIDCRSASQCCLCAQVIFGLCLAVEFSVRLCCVVCIIVVLYCVGLLFLFPHNMIETECDMVKLSVRFLSLSAYTVK